MLPLTARGTDIMNFDVPADTFCNAMRYFEEDEQGKSDRPARNKSNEVLEDDLKAERDYFEEFFGKNKQ